MEKFIFGAVKSQSYICDYFETRNVLHHFFTWRNRPAQAPHMTGRKICTYFSFGLSPNI